MAASRELAVAGRAQRFAAVDEHGELHVGKGERERVHHVAGTPRLPSCARAEICGGRGNARTGRRRASSSRSDAPERPQLERAAVRCATANPTGSRDRAGRARDVGDGGDARQALRRESRALQRVQVAFGVQLARGVPAKRQLDLIRGDAVAVVGDEDAFGAAAVELDEHVARPGVDRVLDQLFDHRGRPLDDLARGDLGRQVRVHDADQAHWRWASCCRRKSSVCACRGVSDRTSSATSSSHAPPSTAPTRLDVRRPSGDALGFEVAQQQRGAAGDALGHAGQPRHVDAVRAVGAALDHRVQEDDVVAAFEHVHAVGAQARQRRGRARSARGSGWRRSFWVRRPGVPSRAAPRRSPGRWPCRQRCWCRDRSRPARPGCGRSPSARWSRPRSSRP